MEWPANVERVRALLSQGRDARATVRPADARRVLHEAETICRSTGHDRALVDVLKGLAQLDRDAGHPARALPALEEAVAVARRQDDPLLLAHTVRHLGDLLMELGDVLAAGPCFNDAVALYRAHPDREALDFANALRPTALHREAMGDVADARQLWAEARDLYERSGIDAGTIECERHLDRLARLAP